MLDTPEEIRSRAIEIMAKAGHGLCDTEIAKWCQGEYSNDPRSISDNIHMWNCIGDAIDVMRTTLRSVER